MSDQVPGTPAGEPGRGSQARFRRYRATRVRGSAAETKDGRPAKRSRSAWALFRRFLSLLRAHRTSMAIALGTLMVSTMFGLIPPAATKLAIDYVFVRSPLPESLRSLVPAAWDIDNDRSSSFSNLIAGIRRMEHELLESEA